MSGGKSGKRSSVKKKSPWLWTKDLLTSQKERLEDYEDYEVKSWSNYMINRFLSMKSDWIEVVNEVQKYPLSPKELYRVYRDILPIRNQFLKYVKGKKNMNHEQWVIDLVAKHFEISESEAISYLEMYYLSEQGKQDLLTLIQSYGVDPKEYKKLNLR